MIVVLILAVLLAVVVLATVVLARSNGSTQAHAVLLHYIADEHERTRELATLLHATVASDSARLATAYERDAGEHERTIAALIADRDRLLTAVLAAGPNPNAARIVGITDNDRARAEVTASREMSLRDFMGEVSAPDTEFANEHGPIIPVGMGSSG